MEAIALRAILAWIKNNWLPILIAVAITGVYFYGKHEGKAAMKAKWMAVRAAEKEAYDKQLADMRAAANVKAAEYEADRTIRNAEMVKIRGRLANVIVKNVNLSNCVADPDFVREYGTAAGADLPGDTR